MKKLFLYTFFYIMIILAPKVFADTSSNADFDPFPQMEQDQKNVEDQTAPAPQEQNDENDNWPPASRDVANSE